ncbi:sulfonate transport system substrate-binding protein [Verrucomicrobium sp. GAS474]|uniref:aliphatic sulfonate ABC transporter substrate-binding protein n=1 Tax=Verrucomicrobium sp. GAS474 TaxID=1882831 RepID=UPI00087DED36|nr:aliphatic sulfonate ABC transporter substrate-binding protein [Verrucomicrobium sp. GAS474]SDT97243.1 sulfonate transport system substrate-binding protein [Verrucomicrobium sp. GAS474]
MKRITLSTLRTVALALVGSLAFSSHAKAAPASTETKLETLNLDFAYYNPVSLVLKRNGWIEKEFAADGTKVSWNQSLGSNKALEFLRAKSLDFGSTAGAAAFLGRANGNPIRAVYVYSKPEWTALVTRPETGIRTVADLKGKKVAVTKGTDPHIFLLRALATAGLTEKDIVEVPLQHSDGKNALIKGDVDAWSGLDPFIGQVEVEKGYPLFYRNPDFNSYGFLNVREEFAREHPAAVKRVLAVYDKTRLWVVAHPDEARQILAEEAKLAPEVAAKVWSRIDFSNGTIGQPQIETIKASASVLKQSGVIPAETDVEKTVADLVDPAFLPKVAAN